MTIITTQSRVTYAGDNVSTVFPIPFEFFLDSDLTVVKQAVGGATSVLVLGVDYSLSGEAVPAGGNLTKTTPLLTGETLAIFLNPPIEQQSHYQSNGPFPASTLENDLDRQTQIALRLSDIQSRSLRAPDGDPAASTAGFLLPSSSARANMYLTFDANGNPAVAAALPSGTLSRAAVGSFIYPQTSAEGAGSITPVDFALPNNSVIGGGLVTRYGVNTTPGTTDMSQAFIEAAAANAVFAVPPGSYRTDTAISQSTYAAIVEGNPTFSGANPFNNWIPAFGGTIQFITTGNQNGLVSALRNNLAANTTAEPCAITAYVRNDNGGNLALGLFARADQMATTGCVTHELNSFNLSGVAASTALPPNRGFATTQNLPICLTIAAGGNASSAIGMQICKEGSQPQQFITGIYVNPDVIAAGGFGMVIDASSASTQSLATLIKHKTGVACAQYQGIGTPVSSNVWFSYVDGGANTQFAIFESGELFFGAGNTATTATTGGTTPPAQVAKYLQVNVGGGTFKIGLYNN